MRYTALCGRVRILTKGSYRYLCQGRGDESNRDSFVAQYDMGMERWMCGGAAEGEVVLS